MSDNKVASCQKNGFINILFKGEEAIEQPKTKDQYHFHKFIEEHVFVPRNKIKHIRILKINDTIYTNFNTLKANHIKKMFIDGSHVRELTPHRQILTQNQPRKTCPRVFSPELKRSDNHKAISNLSYYQQNIEDQDHKQEFKEQKPEQSPPQVMLLSMQQQKSCQQSTASSSNKNVRVSVRYKKIERKIEPSKKMALQLKKEMLRYYSNPPYSPQNISAKSYIIYEHKSQEDSRNMGKCLHAAFNTKINLEIASLTKIMTCILTLQLCDKFKVDIRNALVKIGNFQTKIQGTIAGLQPDQMYSIEQLLYGLMLPSGNDASLALSAFCGEFLQKNAKGCSQDQLSKRYYCRKFVLQMNKKCNELGMKRTIYSNSHGLASILNKSCASDQVILIHYALQNQLFRKIVSTKIYQGTVSKYNLQHKATARSIKWQNTHRLMLTSPEIYLGIKTGTTDAAGPCLASLLSINGRQFIIIVLNSKSNKWRYRDTEQLRQWLCTKQKLTL